MADLLSKYGIYFDEIDKICILEPEASKQTNDLREECKTYIEKIEEFRKIAAGFIDLAEKLGAEVDKQKMKAIGARNVLQNMEKQRDLQQQQLRALITEKSMELERLKIHLNSLQRNEMEQNEIINRLKQY